MTTENQALGYEILYSPQGQLGKETESQKD